MNEFAIEWIKGSKYAGITVPSGTALKSKLFKLARGRPDEMKIIELENYEREIPDEIVEIISDVKNKFNQLYVVFTDYTDIGEREILVFDFN